LLYGWLADRIYFRQYNAWRVDHPKPSAWDMKGLVWAAVIIAMIAPLMLYRASQFPPEERSWIKQTRAVQAGDEVSFKDRFDCLVISEFPIVVWLERRDGVTKPRGENGERFVRREVARTDPPPVNLNR
jgi:glycine betaine/proline transport system permease protein